MRILVLGDSYSVYSPDCDEKRSEDLRDHFKEIIGRFDDPEIVMANPYSPGVHECLRQAVADLDLDNFEVYDNSKVDVIIAVPPLSHEESKMVTMAMNVNGASEIFMIVDDE